MRGICIPLGRPEFLSFVRLAERAVDFHQVRRGLLAYKIGYMASACSSSSRERSYPTDSREHMTLFRTALRECEVELFTAKIIIRAQLDATKASTRPGPHVRRE
jgi:hypothetical protein